MTIYGSPDILDPADLTRRDVPHPAVARERCAATCAVAPATAHDRPTFSGVLIAPDLVLTCRHGVRSPPPPFREFVFRFGPGLGAASTHPQVRLELLGRRVPGTALAAFDFAIVRVGRDPASGERPDAGRVPSPLARGGAAEGRPLYVTGWPHLPGTRGRPSPKVRPRCGVLFPGEATPAELTALRRKVEREAWGERDLPAALKEFDRQYRPVRDGMHRRLVDRSPGAGFVFGLDSDTFDGDSGGGVFDAASDTLVGVFVDGQDDELVGIQAGWARHEFALPTSLVVEEVERARPGWLGREGVTIV